LIYYLNHAIVVLLADVIESNECEIKQTKTVKALSLPLLSLNSLYSRVVLVVIFKQPSQ